MENDLAHYIGNKIKAFRAERKMTQTDLGDVAEISKQAISNYERGYRSPQQNELFAISKALEVSIDELFPPREGTITGIYSQLKPERKESVYTYATDQLEEQQSEDNMSVEEDKQVFIRRGHLSAAGSAIYNDDNDTRLDVRSASLVPKDADELVEIVGDSMEPLIYDGDEVYMRYQPTVENGEVAIVRIQDEGVTCKRVYVCPDKVTLRSINEKYDDMHFDPGMITILGKVIE